jgi:hypothetical protein
MVGVAVDSRPGPRLGQGQRLLAPSHSVNVLARRSLAQLVMPQALAVAAALAGVRVDRRDGSGSRRDHDDVLRLRHLRRWRRWRRWSIVSSSAGRLGLLGLGGGGEWLGL